MIYYACGFGHITTVAQLLTKTSIAPQVVMSILNYQIKDVGFYFNDIFKDLL